MKKITVFILTALLLLSLIGCDGSAQPASSTSTVTTTVPTAGTTVPTTSSTPIVITPFLGDSNGFSEYLNTMGFVPGISQRDIHNLEQTLVNQGDNANYSGLGYNYDSQYGGGYAAQSEYWGVSNDYKRAEDGTSATSTNRLYTRIPLEGLEFPYDITFTSNLSGVLQKIGLSTDPYNGFVSDPADPGVMTLHNDGKVCLALTNFPLKPNILANHPSNFRLNYTEKYEVPLTDGRIADVTRTFSMFFSGSEDTISFISMQVQMQYPLNQD